MAQTTKRITTLEIGADGLFQIPVSLKKIAQATDITLDTASPDGHPMKQIDVDMVTGEQVPSDAKQKGVFRSKPSKSARETWGDFTAISKEDLAVISDATKIDAFSVTHFVALREVPFERVTDAYFLAPAEGMSAKPLVLFAKALKKTKRAGVFKFVKATRQHLGVVYEKDGGLIVNTLAWAADFTAFREAAGALARQDVKVRSTEVEMASQLIELLATEGRVIDEFEDDLVPLRADLVARALKGQELPRRQRKATAVASVDDGLEARLRETLAQTARKRKKDPVPVY